MKRFTILTAAILSLAYGLPSAQAAVIMADKFDSYADQAAFQAAWPAIGTTAPTSNAPISQLVPAPSHQAMTPETRLSNASGACSQVAR